MPYRTNGITIAAGVASLRFLQRLHLGGLQSLIIERTPRKRAIDNSRG